MKTINLRFNIDEEFINFKDFKKLFLVKNNTINSIFLLYLYLENLPNFLKIKNNNEFIELTIRKNTSIDKLFYKYNNLKNNLNVLKLIKKNNFNCLVNLNELLYLDLLFNNFDFNSFKNTEINELFFNKKYIRLNLDNFEIIKRNNICYIYYSSLEENLINSIKFDISSKIKFKKLYSLLKHNIDNLDLKILLSSIESL